MNTAVTGATGTTGSAPPSGQPATGGGDVPWHSSIPDEGLRNYVATKGFKDPAALAESYRQFERLQGVPQDRLLRLPEKADDPAWGEIYTKLGRPMNPEGYELQFEGDDAFAKKMAGIMHGANLTKAQAEALNTAWNQYVAELIQEDTNAKTAADAAKAAADAAAIAGLKSEWGGDYTKNEELARRAGREFGLSEEQFTAISASLGQSDTLKLFQKIGAKMGEPAPFDTKEPGPPQFGMTAEAARSRRQTLLNDPAWVTAYTNGDKSKLAELSDLEKIIAGGA